MTNRNLIIITGQEGAGKSTLCKALLPITPNAASFDAENVGQTNPWEMNDAFIDLLWNNVEDLTRNFWEAGFNTVIAGSFMDTYSEFTKFRERFPDEANVIILHLCASKSTRDQRRLERAKPTTKEWRDDIDMRYPEDISLGQAHDEYRYVQIENSEQSLEETVHQIREALPEIYG